MPEQQLKVKVMHAPPPRKRTWWDEVYVPEIIRGLVITGEHFWENMWVHLRRLVGIKTRKRGAVTYQYPDEKRPLSPRTRTLHRLTKRSDGSPRCVACMMCETICPARCIYIVGAEHPDPNIEKYPVQFDIDIGVCVMCGLCVEACPEDAIRMDTGILEFSAYSREGMIYHLPELLR